jgi:hypothetical protein
VTLLAEFLDGKQSLLLAPLDGGLLVDDESEEFLSVPLGPRIDLLDVSSFHRFVHSIHGIDFLLM